MNLEIRPTVPNHYAVYDGENRITVSLPEDDARRIVACVNACEGIPTAELEITRVGEIWDGYMKQRGKCDRLREENEQLRAALQAMLDQPRKPRTKQTTLEAFCIDAARAALNQPAPEAAE